MAQISLKVNGRVRMVDTDAATPLLYVLRNDLELQGPRFGCGLGQCGACTAVILDGKAIRSCITPVNAAQNRAITTLEGLGSSANRTRIAARVRRRAGRAVRLLHEQDLMNAKALLDKNPSRRRDPHCPRPNSLPLRQPFTGDPRHPARHRVRVSPRRANMKTHAISRRELLKTSGALVVSFSLFGPATRALAQQFDTLPLPPGSNPYNNPDYLDPTSLDSWLAVMQDSSVTVFAAKLDLGTGIQTALAQIVADELDVRLIRSTWPWATRRKLWTKDARRAATPSCAPGRNYVTRPPRDAVVLKLAAARLEAPAEKLVVAEGVVRVDGSPAKKVSYGELLGGKRFNVKVAAKGIQTGLDVAPEAHVKDFKEYKVVGTSVPRVDLLPKLIGEFTYTSDFRVPGMLHGRVVRPATVLSKPASVDESSVRGIPGVVKVVQEGSFVGVVATTEWAAIQAARGRSRSRGPPPSRKCPPRRTRWTRTWRIRKVSWTRSSSTEETRTRPFPRPAKLLRPLTTGHFRTTA